MKKLLLLSTFLFLRIAITAQTFCSFGMINFDFENNYCENLQIDTTTYPFNSWQIGKPQKSNFNSALSPQNAIVTDTVNTYPVNDTSVFYFVATAEWGYVAGAAASIGGNYWVDSDSLNDYGTIEVSPDNGNTWIDIVNPGIYSSSINWATPIPVLTGKSNGWVLFVAGLSSLGPLFNVQFGDTIRYRFTFISDSIPDSLDGLMFDDFGFDDWAEGIEEFNNGNIFSSTNPNPASEQLSINFNNPMNENFDLKVYDILGNEILNENELGKNSFDLDVNSWNAGLYYYRLFDESGEKWATGKFVVSD